MPLSAKGSLSDPGGRFNIGDIDSTRFPPFSALYVAQDKETGVQEVIGPLKTDPQLSAYEYALADPTSLTNVSVSGFLESVVDVRNKHLLKSFVDIIKKFEIPSDLIQMARDLKVAEPTLIETVDQLIAVLSDSSWRNSPMQLEIPSAPQIFGQLVMEAGVEGIIYPSMYTDKACLAIFPRNFEKSESFVQLDDTPPLDTVVRRLDASNWQSI